MPLVIPPDSAYGYITDTSGVSAPTPRLSEPWEVGALMFVIVVVWWILTPKKEPKS